MKYEFFWESDSPFSQWYKAEFIVKELEFFLKGKSEKKEFVEIFSKNERIIEISELITKDGLKFNCCEQFMMVGKALLFNDIDSAIKILMTKNSRKQKELGRSIKNFDENIWKENRENIVYTGNSNKFAQNLNLKEALINTGNKILVEASPYDKIWGIGLTADDERSNDESNWQGLNLLGKILTKIRDEM